MDFKPIEYTTRDGVKGIFIPNKILEGFNDHHGKNMTVKWLLNEIIECCKDEDFQNFLDWEVAVEFSEEKQKDKEKQGFKFIEGDDDKYIICAGFCTKFFISKVFTINYNY